MFDRNLVGLLGDNKKYIYQHHDFYDYINGIWILYDEKCYGGRIILAIVWVGHMIYFSVGVKTMKPEVSVES